MPVNFHDLDDADADPAQAPASRASFSHVAGDIFDGRFQLLRVLGKGGAGVVWEARSIHSSQGEFDPALAQLVALKIVPIPSTIRAVRARREISIGLDLDGPHFVRIFSAGTVPPYAYVSMERLEGEDLACRLDRDGKLSITDTLRIGWQIARGLAAAHGRGLVHRDLKPTNVFLARPPPTAKVREVVKILDFGVAKRLGVDSRVTASDTLLGAPQYSAPEQIQNARNVDTRADVWSLAAIQYRCLLGRRPFDGVGGALLATVLATPHDAPTSIDPQLPRSVDEVFIRGLAKHPDDRYRTATELLAALERALLNPSQ